MGDQMRWFKLWCSAPGDPDLLALSPALRWAWAALGCYTTLHGTRGVLVTSPVNAVLAAEMGTTPDALLGTLQCLPHVRVGDAKDGHGQITVTWANWYKYQTDTTHADRKRRARSKRRGEEKREDQDQPPPVSPPDGGDGMQVVHGTEPQTAAPAPDGNGTPPKARKKPARNECTDCQQVLKVLNDAIGSAFRGEGKAGGYLHARHVQHGTAACVQVVKDRVRRWWPDSEMRQYLRPLTLFAPSNFEGYLMNARPPGPTARDERTSRILDEVFGPKPDAAH